MVAIDGLASKELQGNYVIANKMGVTEDKVDKIKDLIDEEEAPKKKRALPSVFFPVTHP